MVVPVPGPGREANVDRTVMVRRWRQVELGNTIAGVVVCAVVPFLLSPLATVLTIAAMTAGVADTWYLGRRLRRTGQLFRDRSS